MTDMPIGNTTWMVNDFADNQGNKLFTWDEAVKNTPQGYRLPEKKDFDDLIAIAQTSSSPGEALKSPCGWCMGKNGLNLLNFNGTPTGYKFKHSNEKGCDQLRDPDKYACYWSKDESADEFQPAGVPPINAYYYELSSMHNGLIRKLDDKGYRLAVRYVKI